MMEYGLLFAPDMRGEYFFGLIMPDSTKLAITNVHSDRDIKLSI